MSAEPTSPFADSRSVAGLEECTFYHTMELPGVGLVEGPWDLRAGAADYLGHVEFGGKRALDMGTASGFLCFEMERRGADVVAYDLSDRSEHWDIVPFGGAPDPTLTSDRAAGMRLINNSFWFAHAALGSHAQVAYGSVYQLPPDIGPVDVAVFGAILLHLRDPFRALERALALTTETVVVTEPVGRSARPFARLPRPARDRLATATWLPANAGFLPDPLRCLPYESWWRLPPWTVARMVAVLGFEMTSLTFHSQNFCGSPTAMYTVVGRRRAGPHNASQR